jgi:nucleoside-diphosphate-sugar epimerase
MCLFGKTEDFFSGIMNFEPRITYNFAKKIAADWTTSIEKAKTELGYRVTPFREAVRKTVEWLMNK